MKSLLYGLLHLLITVHCLADEVDPETGEYIIDIGGGDRINLDSGEYYMGDGDGGYFDDSGDWHMKMDSGTYLNLNTGELKQRIEDNPSKSIDHEISPTQLGNEISPSQPSNEITQKKAKSTLFLRASDLVEWCTGRDKIACSSYLIGWKEAELYLRIRPGIDPIYCPPGKITQGEIDDTIISYLRDNPDITQYPATIAIYIALTRIWPC